MATLVKLLHAQALDTERLATELISVSVAGGQGAVSGDASYGAVVWYVDRLPRDPERLLEFSDRGLTGVQPRKR